MHWNNKVLWTEGMLLQQQHLQQHDRYLNRLIDMRCGQRPGSGWGFSRLIIDDALLQQGKLALLECEAILPDGTPLSLPYQDPLPAPLDIDPMLRDTEIVLALPLSRPGQTECGDDASARYRITECEVVDNTRPMQDPVPIQVGTLKLQLAPAAEVTNAYACLGVARVLERHSDNRLVLDGGYIPPCLDIRAAPPLARFIGELAGLLHQRGDTLAMRMTQADSGTVARMADLLVLQIINRHEPLFDHLSVCSGVHPETLWRHLLALTGELSTHSEPFRPAELPLYRPDALDRTFLPLFERLRQQLRYVADPLAFAIPLHPHGHGRSLAAVPDSTLFTKATFILAARAEMPDEEMAELLPAHVKIGPLERIADLVNLQLPAIGLQPLAMAPQQIPYHAGYRYFALDMNHPCWPQLAQSAGLALHVAGDFPGLSLEMWAVLARKEGR
jgi:type VI secretion system protein ImpJ